MAEEAGAGDTASALPAPHPASSRQKKSAPQIKYKCFIANQNLSSAENGCDITQLMVPDRIIILQTAAVVEKNAFRPDKTGERRSAIALRGKSLYTICKCNILRTYSVCNEASV
jgi:hypothetical protein